MRYLQIILLVFCCFSTLPNYSQRVMWWNVENLFNCTHDSLKDDYEFMPDGTYHWTPYRYWRKLDNISRTIAAVSEQSGWPMLIGVCEIENDSVLFDLTCRSPLRTAYYNYVHEEGPDERGVDVALLYQPNQFTVLGHETLRVPTVDVGLRATRDILHVWGTCVGVDTLHVVVVHFPSRVGGRDSNRSREMATQTLCNLVDRNKGSKLLLMGDFNAEPDGAIFLDIKKRLNSLMPQRRRELRKAQGTYFFRGQWGFIDHIFVSPELQPYVVPRAEVGKFPFLLTEKGTPWRTFQGPAYKAGFSDHLPIWVDLFNK